ncbi:hypothetical protein C8F04DRAFT_973735, partial [Mycena alexandri]
SSIFSAASFELGGLHCRTIAQGIPHRFLPGAFSILTALGKYNHNCGSHIILWELGFVISFPPGASIILPTGVIHYSFVRVRPDETRYSLLQWAGSGITRYLRNGYNMDLDFAQASEAKPAAREERRKADHAAVLGAFPVEAELDDCAMSVPFFGYPAHPTAAINN